MPGVGLKLQIMQRLHEAWISITIRAVNIVKLIKENIKVMLMWVNSVMLLRVSIVMLVQVNIDMLERVTIGILPALARKQ